MSETQLPALSGLNKAELQAAHLKEIGAEAAADLTVDALRAALTEYRAANPVTPPAPKLTPSRAADTVTVIDNETQAEQVLPLAVWNELGPVGQAAFTIKADKPAELG